MGASEQLSGAGEGGAGAVGVDPQGRITAVSEGQLRHARHPHRAAAARPAAVGRRDDLAGLVVPAAHRGDTAGDVTVSYTHDVSGGSQRYIYAVDRPNSGPWGTQTAVGGPANISDLVVAPNSGRATVFWQNGSTSDPLAARTRAAGTPWSVGETTQIPGGTAERLDLDLDGRARARRSTARASSPRRGSRAARC